jgi:hypothetical protein
VKKVVGRTPDGKEISTLVCKTFGPARRWSCPQKVERLRQRGYPTMLITR